MYGRPCLLPRSAPIDDAGDHALNRAPSLHAVRTDEEAFRTKKFIGKESLPKLWVIGRQGYICVVQMCVMPVWLGHLIPWESVIRRRREVQQPAQHLARDSLAREIRDEGIHHCGFTQRLRYTATRRRTSLSRSSCSAHRGWKRGASVFDGVKASG